MRKMISFKIENLPDKQRQIVDQWADGQSNIQQSLANIVMHVVEFVGNADVMDFDVQRKLHTIFVNNESNHEQKQYLQADKIELEAQNVHQVQAKQQPETPKTENDVISQAVDLFENED